MNTGSFAFIAILVLFQGFSSLADQPGCLRETGLPAERGIVGLSVVTSPPALRLSGACTNADDLKIPKSAQENAIHGCASIWGKKHTSNCMVEKLRLTRPCADCWAEVAACGIKNCKGACIGGADSEGCRKCTKDNGCDSAFSACSGI